MQADAATAPGLDRAQRAAAAAGRKALVPIRGRPFLAWVLDHVARAGFRSVCVVTDDVVALNAAIAEPALPLACVRQTDPRGTADAVLAAEPWVGRGSFIVINGDNLYPVAALALLRTVPPPATVGFPPRDRVESYALMRADAGGCLAEIVEKPDAAARERLGPGAAVSMTCWSFGPAIFPRCRGVRASPRGELELPDAVRALAADQCVRMLRHEGEVFDLGTAADIPLVARRLGA